MGQDPSQPPRPPGGNESPDVADPRRQGGVATRKRRKAPRPPRIKQVHYNDAYTPMEFVVSILEKIFGKGPSEATQIMLKIHNTGLGVAGVYVLEVAETKVSRVHREAEARGFPLRAGVEKE